MSSTPWNEPHNDPAGPPPPYRPRERGFWSRPCRRQKATEGEKAWAGHETTVQAITHAIRTAAAAAAWVAEDDAKGVSKEAKEAAEGMAAAIIAVINAICGLPRGLAGLTDVVAMWIKYMHETNTPYAARRAAGESPASLTAITTVHCATTYVKGSQKLSRDQRSAIPQGLEKEMRQQVRKAINLVPAESGPRVTAAMHAAIAKVAQEVATTDKAARRAVATSYTNFALRTAEELCLT